MADYKTGFELIYDSCFNGPQAGMLVFGKKANEILRAMHDRAAGEGYLVSWVNNPLNIEDFWKQASSGIGYDSVSVSDYRENLIAKGKQHHVHITNFDEILFRFDVKNGMSLNSAIKKLWFEVPDLMHIYGSYGTNGSSYIGETLGDRRFALKKENFSSIEDIYFT